MAQADSYNTATWFPRSLFGAVMLSPRAIALFDTGASNQQARPFLFIFKIDLPERSPPNGVELMPPRPREGAAVVVDMTLVVSPVRGADETEPNPKPK